MRLQLSVHASSGGTTNTSGCTSTSGPQEMSAGEDITMATGSRCR
jgi:hypothetical protein